MVLMVLCPMLSALLSGSMLLSTSTVRVVAAVLKLLLLPHNKEINTVDHKDRFVFVWCDTRCLSNKSTSDITHTRTHTHTHTVGVPQASVAYKKAYVLIY